MTGRITQIIRGRSCGFIRTVDGQQVFFHASDVDGLKFHQLEDRAAVRFTLVEDRLSGPRATRVRIAGAS